MKIKCHGVNFIQQVFSILTHGAHVDCVFSLLNAQWPKEQNLGMTFIESVCQWKSNIDCTCKAFDKQVMQNKELFHAAKPSGKNN